jgi:hypothetical protein
MRVFSKIRLALKKVFGNFLTRPKVITLMA